MRGLRGWLVAVALAAPAGVSAQAVSVGVAMERYSFGSPTALDIGTLTLLSAPFAATYDAGRGIVFRLSGGVARGTLVLEDGGESSVSGLLDTELSARIQTAGGGVALTAVVQLPTGKGSLTFEELFVAGAIAADLLPFRVRDWGTGGGAGASLALARPFGAFAAGVSAAYVVAREYQPLSEDEFDYRPGDQLHLQAAVDRVIGRSAKLALSMDWRRYGADDEGGRNAFQTGDRLQVRASYDFAIGRSSAITYAGWLSRDEGEYTAPPDLLVAQDLFFAGGGVRTSLGGRVVVPSIDLRKLDAAGTAHAGWLAGAGALVELSVAGAAVMPEARVRFGRVEAADGGETGVSGVTLGLTVRFGGT